MSGRVVVVTGSSGGIGSAMVERFAANGDTPVGLDLADGFDVTDPEQCRATADRIVAEHGRIDVLCNNAGISAVGDVVQSTPDDWQRLGADYLERTRRWRNRNEASGGTPDTGAGDAP